MIRAYETCHMNQAKETTFTKAVNAAYKPLIITAKAASPNLTNRGEEHNLHQRLRTEPQAIKEHTNRMTSWESGNHYLCCSGRSKATLLVSLSTAV